MGPAAVLSISVMDVTEAERMLRSLVNTAPAEEGMGRNSRITFVILPLRPILYIGCLRQRCLRN